MEQPGTIARLLLVALGVFAALVEGGAATDSLMGLAAGYVVFAAVMFGFGSRQSTWLACLSAAVDVTAVTTFVFLVGATRLPLWILYVFPLATAGAAGLIPALVGGGLVLGDGAIVVSSSQQTVRPADLWPLAVLGAAAILVAVLPSFWLVEWREKRAREEITWLREMGRRERVLGKAANQMLGTFEAGQVRAAAIAAAADGLDLSVAVIDRDDVQRASEEESMAPVGDTRTALAMGQEAALTVSAEDGPAARHGQRWLERLSEVTDIALQRCAEHEALQAEEQRLRAIWERLPAPAALWGPGGDMLPANGAYRDLGLVAHPTMNEPGEDLTIGEPARTFVVMNAHLPASNCQLEVLRDVTQERDELRAKDEFLSLVGHELRTPLTSIHGFGQMIGRNLNVIQQQVGQLDRLIDDLMAESSGRGGQLSLDLQLVDVAELATATAERFKASYSDRPLALQVEHVDAVRGDPARLAQVIDNLLGNAVKYSPADQEILLRVRRGEGSVLIGVQDRGMGIPKEHLPHLFDRFYRVPGAATDRVKGLGLGLFIVRDLVAVHGGRVWAESEGSGHGSTFWVSLPLASPAFD